MAKRTRTQQTADIPGWSWLVSAVGVVLVLGCAAFMLYRAFAGESSPPELMIETDAVVLSGNSYLVPIRVINRGGAVAAELVVEGVLEEGGAPAETSEITLDYVPAGSERRAGLIFSRDPRTLDLQIRAAGYVEP